MIDTAPQPDLYLCIPAESGGQVRPAKKNYYAGAPELAVEITESSTQIDFGAKMALCARSGVREYITVEPYWNKLTWRSLVPFSYRDLKPGADGIVRSRVFPGITAVLEQQCAEPAHAALVHKLARGR